MDCLQPFCRWWRWVITAATFVLFFLALGPMFNYSILFVSLQDEFDTSSAITGWLGSLSGALACLSSPFNVLLGRKLSKRNIVLIGVVVNCLGLLTTSFVPSIGYAYLTYGVLVGVSTNFMTHTSMALLMDWFQKKNFSRASAIAQFGSSCGMLVFSPILTECITHYGWRNALRILSSGVVVGGVLDSFLLSEPPAAGGDYAAVPGKPPLPPRALQAENHESGNSVPLKEIQAGGHIEETADEGQGSEDGRVHAVEEEDESDEPRLRGVSQVTSCRGTLILLQDLEAWLWFAGVTVSSIGWTFFTINFASFMDDTGLSSNQISLVISCFAGGDLGGKLVMAVVADRLPFLYVYAMAASMLLGSVILGILTVAQTYQQMVILAIVSGVVQSGFNGPLFVAGSQLFHTKYGSNDVMAMTLVPLGIGKLISAPLSGGLHDVTGDYILSLLVIAAIFVFALLAYLLIPLRRRLQSRGSCCPPETRPVDL